MKSWILAIFLFSGGIFSGTLSLFTITRSANIFSLYNIVLGLIIVVMFIYELLKKIKINDKVSHKKFQIVLLLVVLSLSILISFIRFYPSDFLPQITKYFISYTLPAIILALIITKKDILHFYKKLGYINIYITICFAVSIFRSSQMEVAIFNNLAGSSHLLVGYTMSALFAYNIIKLVYEKRLPFKLLYLFLLSFNVTVIVFSGARGALVSVFVIFIFASIKYFLNKSRIIILAAILLMFYILVTAISKNQYFKFAIERISNGFSFEGDASTQTRFTLYDLAIQLFEENPILGSGISSFSNEIGRYYYPHNIGFEILSDFGLIGMSFFLIIFWFVFKRGKSLLQYEPGYHLIVFLFINSFVQLIFTGSYLVDPQFWITGVLIWVIDIKCINERVKTREYVTNN